MEHFVDKVHHMKGYYTLDKFVEVVVELVVDNHLVRHLDEVVNFQLGLTQLLLHISFGHLEPDNF